MRPLLLLFAPLLLAAADEWPQFRGNPQLTGVAAGTVPANLKLLWMMIPSARIPNLLGFYTIGQQVALTRFPINLQGMLEHALATAR